MRKSFTKSDKIQSTSPKTEFRNWFKGSVVVDDNGKPLKVYHGSIELFDKFDIAKIKHNETDANYNGFWFTSDKKYASPAFRDPNYIRSYYLALKNPAPISLANKVYKEIYHNYEKYEKMYDTANDYKSSMDMTRLELQKMGYDGVIHLDRPNIDWKAFEKNGEYTFTTTAGSQRQIVANKELGGIDLNYANGDNITGYLDKADFLDMHSERIYVMFDPNSIREVK